MVYVKMANSEKCVDLDYTVCMMTYDTETRMSVKLLTSP